MNERRLQTLAIEIDAVAATLIAIAYELRRNDPTMVERLVHALDQVGLPTGPVAQRIRARARAMLVGDQAT